MTVAATTNRKTYTGDNVTTSFATSPVIFYATSDLQVRVTVIATGVSTLLTLNTHYTVTGGSSAGAVGTVSLAGGSSPHGALLSTEKLVILRVLPLTQGVDLVNNNNSDAEVLEAALDKLTDVDQQIQEQADRSIRFASGDVSGSVTELSDVTTRAGRILGFDATGLLTTFIVTAGTSLVDFASSIGSSLIGFIQAGTGAILRTVQAKLRDNVCVFDYMTAAQIADVQARTELLDVESAIVNAINACGSNNLVFPPGTYSVGATQVINQQTDGSHPPTRLAAFKMRSDLHCVGVPGESIIKAKANISSDAAPLYFNMFMSNTYDTNVSFDGLTFDMNGANNKISPARPAVYNVFHQSHLFWGSDTSNVCRVDNLYVNNCIFKNTPGTNCIVTQFSITTPPANGVGCAIKNCQFIDNGFDTNDHSSLYLPSNKVTVAGNTFSIPTQTIITQNCMEFHGQNVVCSGNVVTNYLGGIDITGGDSGADVFNIEVCDNIMRCKFDCVVLIRNVTGAGTLLHDINIHDNIFELEDYLDPLAQDPACIQVFPNTPVTDVFIHHNRLSKIGGTTYGSYGVQLGNATPGSNSDNIHIENNNINLFGKGISWTSLAGTGGCGKLYISDNTITNCTTTVTPVILATGIEVAPIAGQTIVDLYLAGNRVYDTTGTTSRGISIAGTITNYYQNDNLSIRSGTADYVETSVTITTRRTGTYILSANIPNTQTGATYTVLNTDSAIIANRAGTVTLTLEAASVVPGKMLWVRTIQAQTVVSASGNVVPRIGGAAGTAILAATAGAWALLQSDGTNWQIMAGS